MKKKKTDFEEFLYPFFEQVHLPRNDEKICLNLCGFYQDGICSFSGLCGVAQLYLTPWDKDEYQWITRIG